MYAYIGEDFNILPGVYTIIFTYKELHLEGKGFPLIITQPKKAAEGGA